MGSLLFDLMPTESAEKTGYDRILKLYDQFAE